MTAKAPKIYPCLSYEDPKAAIDFLSRAFGFSPLLVVPGPDGSITHAEVHLGPEIVMLGAARPDLGWVSPRQLSGRNATICVYVPDVDAHYAAARQAGATITRELRDTAYGAREYSATDLEGNEWHFGTYRPVAPEPESQ